MSALPLRCTPVMNRKIDFNVIFMFAAEEVLAAIDPKKGDIRQRY